ncbi:hypothetical protein N0V92_011930 [Colletotrichum tropicale]|nr:hypothetical protein N0V92_011930 [Colletotrichum tropicale]
MGRMSISKAIIATLATVRVAMSVYTELPSDLTEVDIIIAGGGTAGSIIASRLAEADASTTILVIEQGGDSYNVTNVIYPALFERNTLPGSDTALFWKANKSPQLADREPIVETGGILGGGSSINWMVYTRGQWDDFDSWNTSGWTAEDVLPYLKKVSLVTRACVCGSITRTHEAPRAEASFIEGVKKTGFEEIVDLQSLHSNNGSGPWYRYVSPEDGRRQDVGHRYLHPLLQSGDYPNLHVLVESQVLRVLFDDTKRATGVEFRPNPNLAKAGQDNNHHFVGYVYRTSLNQNETINGIARNDRGRDVPAMIAADDPQLGWNGHDASSKLRPSSADIAALGPEFQKVWDRDFKDSPNRPLMIWGLFNAFFGDPSILSDDAEYVTTAPWVTYPYARGHVHITGPNIDDDYDFDPGWLLDENDIDLKSHIWGYKTQRKMARQMDIFRGELTSGQPKFPEGSKAAVIEVADGPIGEEIEYSVEDEAAIVQYIRENIGTSRHPLGTCKMAPREATGVGKTRNPRHR